MSHIEAPYMRAAKANDALGRYTEMPADENTRVCRQCRKRFRMYQKELTQKGINLPARAWFLYENDPHGYFCTMQCAATFGIQAASREAANG